MTVRRPPTRLDLHPALRDAGAEARSLAARLIGYVLLLAFLGLLGLSLSDTLIATVADFAAQRPVTAAVEAPIAGRAAASAAERWPLRGSL